MKTFCHIDFNLHIMKLLPLFFIVLMTLEDGIGANGISKTTSFTY